MGPETFWHAFGILGALTFYGRFYVQWIVSERRGRSIVPIAFWYMSSAGSLILLSYAVYLQSPLGALGQSLNIVIYARNLVHLWRERGRLSKRRDLIIHIAVGAIAVAALALVILTWLREYRMNAASPTGEAARNWIWLAVGMAGQGLFACRFLIQWIVTEVKRRSVIPPVFWRLSILAALLQIACFVQRAACIPGHRMEFVYAAGMATTVLIYARNLWLIHIHPGPAPGG